MPRFVCNLWPAIIWFLGIFLLTILPGNYIPEISGFWSLFSPDKLVHLALFAGLAYLLMMGLIKQYPETDLRFIYIVVACSGILFAIITELLQWYLPIKRDGNIFDGIANVIGLFAGIAFFTFMKIKNQKK
ncbi:MAG: VanZ family protein [Lentimicrobium sp.]|nr:VanZ family protein [Lentimicrobium sp.]